MEKEKVLEAKRYFETMMNGMLNDFEQLQQEYDGQLNGKDVKKLSAEELSKKVIEDLGYMKKKLWDYGNDQYNFLEKDLNIYDYYIQAEEAKKQEQPVGIVKEEQPEEETHRQFR